MILSTQCQCIFRRQTGRCTESFSPHCRPLGDSKLTPEQCSSSSSSSTMYGRQEARAALSRRPHAVEKAMQMKIKKVSIFYWHSCLDDSLIHVSILQVPWWNKRSRLERRLLLVTVSLVLLISVLIAAIVLTVKSYEPSNVSQPGNVLKWQNLSIYKLCWGTFLFICK